MPTASRPPQGNRAVQRADAPQPQAPGPSSALVAVTREIDNRLAIVRASSAAGIDPDRLKLVALTAFTRSPELMACEPVSVARAIVEAGQLGLEPTGLLGGAYLVPRGGKATLMIGYRGLVILALRSQVVQRVEARIVREKDAFEYGYGLDPYVRHVPAPMGTDPGELVAAYAVLVYRDGQRHFDVMSKAEIEVIRGRSSAGRAGPWITDYFEMAKKTVLRRLLKLAPLTVQVAERLDEIDPEVDEPHAAQVGSRQAELRRQLQEALTNEYGTAPVEGQFRELPAADAGATTQAAGTGTPDGQAGEAAKGGSAPPQATEQAQQATGAPSGGGAPVPAAKPAGKPESVGAILGQPCAIHHAGLGLGPCTLPAGHTVAAWADTSGASHPAQAEHDDGNGNRWTMPQQAKKG